MKNNWDVKVWDAKDEQSSLDISDISVQLIQFYLNFDITYAVETNFTIRYPVADKIQIIVAIMNIHIRHCFGVGIDTQQYKNISAQS